jgi:hypothetical protein
VVKQERPIFYRQSMAAGSKAAVIYHLLLTVEEFY